MVFEIYLMDGKVNAPVRYHFEAKLKLLILQFIGQ